MSIPSLKAGAVDNIGLALENGGEQFRVILGVIFQVCILDQQDITGSGRNARPQCRPFALVDSVEYLDNSRLLRAILDQLPGSIC